MPFDEGCGGSGSAEAIVCQFGKRTTGDQATASVADGHVALGVGGDIINTTCDVVERAFRRDVQRVQDQARPPGVSDVLVVQACWWCKTGRPKTTHALT
jgi:hypothetical protein